MHVEPTDIPGCFLVQARSIGDERGRFVKTFHAPTFEALGLRTDWREEYHSSSVSGVVRGMHFQTPPADHAKYVHCVAGQVVDVVVDLRKDSPTFHQHRSFTLDGDAAAGIYIPTGCAHGFVSLSESSTLYYKVTSIHAPDQDAGIAWDSFGFDWPVARALLSPRDRNHPPLADFESPFLFDAADPAR